MGRGCTSPFWGAMETTFHSSERWKILTIDAWDNFDDTGKKSFSYLKERSQKSNKMVKGVYNPLMNPSPMKNKRTLCVKKWIHWWYLHKIWLTGQSSTIEMCIIDEVLYWSLDVKSMPCKVCGLIHKRHTDLLNITVDFSANLRKGVVRNCRHSYQQQIL